MLGNQSDTLVAPLGRLHEKKLLFFGFCPNEGGEGPAQILCPLFTNCIYWVNLGMGREGEPLPNFFGTLAFKKAVQVVQIRDGGVDKIQKNSYFFTVKPSLNSANLLLEF